MPIKPGALAGGWISRWAPEIQGGGGDAAIHAFHHRNGVIRRRVAPLKALATILTLGSGGAGGREGPAIQIGAGIGTWIGRILKVSPSERRILFVAGIAAGVSGMLRTPLGAALLAVEVLYRDDFEAEALVPAVLSSVISYSVVIFFFGQSTLFAQQHFGAFQVGQLPLHVLLAICIACVALLFLAVLRGTRRLSLRIPLPVWARPAVGGLLLGILATIMLIALRGQVVGQSGKGLGILGGGYGLAEVAIVGCDWLPGGWSGVQLLLVLSAVKLVGAALTIGTGGSTGDFAPSIVIGGLVGGAFGHAASLGTGDPSIQPGAFALVGMGAFYGGVAHVPLAALILVSEMAGSYDLLVPSMLAIGSAYLILRRWSLYEAQVPSRADSPVHQQASAPPATAPSVIAVLESGGGATHDDARPSRGPGAGRRSSRPRARYPRTGG